MAIQPPVKPKPKPIIPVKKTEAPSFWSWKKTWGNDKINPTVSALGGGTLVAPKKPTTIKPKK